MGQINAKQYAQRHRNPVKLGIAIDDSKRCIGGYRLDDAPFQAVGPEWQDSPEATQG
jgi:hypothetical protein